MTGSNNSARLAARFELPAPARPLAMAARPIEGAQIVINDVFASWLADEYSGKERRLYCYGDRSDPIPTMFMIRKQFWDMVGNSTGENRDSRRCQLEGRLDEQAEQLDSLIADTVATSVEGIAAQLCLLTTFLESSPLGEYGNNDADKRLLAAIYAGIQGFIDREGNLDEPGEGSVNRGRSPVIKGGRP
jgi:hypothetical protein